MSEEKRPVLDLLHKYFGVNEVTLRYISSTGNLSEHLQSVSELPKDFSDEGVELPDGGGRIFPDMLSAWMNPFDDVPSLAFICYSSKEQAKQQHAAAGSTAANMFMSPPSASMNFASSPGFRFGVGGTPMAAPQMFLPSAALAGDWSQPYAGGLSSPLVRGMAPPPLAMPGPIPIPEPSEANPVHHRRQNKAPSPVKPSSQAELDAAKASAGKTGTSCHQCKNARPSSQLAFCNMLFVKRAGGDKRICRKKYCDTCLLKFYNDDFDNAKDNNQWYCPSCRNMCTCASCSRKSGGGKRNTPAGGGGSFSHPSKHHKY